MINMSRPPGNGRKKKLAVFSALWRASAMLLITMTAMEKALQFYVCPPECCSAAYAWNRPNNDKEQGKPSLDFVNAAEVAHGCMVNYAETDNCFNPQDAQDAHEIVKVERKPFEAEPSEAGYDDSDAFIRFVKKNHKEVEREFAKAMNQVKDIKEDDRTLHTECGDFKKVFISGRWTYVAQT